MLFARSLLKNISLYAFANIMLRAISFLTFPIWSKYISTSEYGLLELCFSYQNIFLIITSWNLAGYLRLEYIHLDSKARSELIIQILITYTLLTSIITLAHIPLFSIINNLLFQNHLTIPLLARIILLAGITFFLQINTTILRFEERTKLFTIIQVIQGLLITLAYIIGIPYFQWNIADILSAQIIILGAVALFLSKTVIFPIPKISFSRKILKKTITAGAQLFPMSVGDYLFSSGDKFVLAHYGSLHSVALYSLASKFAEIFQLIIANPLNMAYQPYIQKRLKSGPAYKIKRENTQNMALFLVTMLVGLSMGYIFAKPLLFHFIPSKFHDALQYIFLLCFAHILTACITFSGAQIIFHKKIRFLSSALLLSGTLNIALNIVLIKNYNVMGCVISTVISSALYLALTLIYQRKISS